MYNYYTLFVVFGMYIVHIAYIVKQKLFSWRIQKPTMPGQPLEL